MQIHNKVIPSPGIIGGLTERRVIPVTADDGDRFIAQQPQRLHIPHFRFIQGIALQHAVSTVTTGNQQVEHFHDGADFVVHRVILGDRVRVNRIQRVGVPGGILQQRTDPPVTGTGCGRTPRYSLTSGGPQ